MRSAAGSVQLVRNEAESRVQRKQRRGEMGTARGECEERGGGVAGSDGGEGTKLIAGE